MQASFFLPFIVQPSFQFSISCCFIRISPFHVASRRYCFISYHAHLPFLKYFFPRRFITLHLFPLQCFMLSICFAIFHCLPIVCYFWLRLFSPLTCLHICPNFFVFIHKVFTSPSLFAHASVFKISRRPSHVAAAFLFATPISL